MPDEIGEGTVQEMKKLLLCISIYVWVMVSMLFLPAVPAMADSVTDTVSIYVGYFGWDEDQFVEKATYTWRELDDMFGGALDTHEIVYSYYSGKRTYLVAARGFYIRDLLEYAGIDFGSISRIDFFTKDQKVGAYRSFTKASLFDMPRYYFPNLAASEETGAVYPYQGDDIWNGAIQVEPMLALEDYTEWDSVGCLFENLYDSTMFSASSRFHLFFGQLAPTEANTSSAAKYVYKLFITFSGTPLLSTEETNIGLKVGSNFRMTVNISAEDSLLDQYVKDNLQWSSNNEKVISVDKYGNLTVKGEGEAVITVSFGSSSVSTTVKVGEGTAEVIGTGPGHSGNDGDSLLPGGASPDPQPDRVDSNAQPETSEPAAEDTSENMEETAAPEDAVISDVDNEVQYSENSKGVYILSSELMAKPDYAEWVNSVLKHKFIENNGEGALNNARKEAMDADAQQLILLAKVTQSFTVAVCLVLAGFFISGFGYGILRYRRSL